jgi:uncharacterized membrane protein YbhN (UPF0104 family)
MRTFDGVRGPRLFAHDRSEPRARRFTDVVLLSASLLALWLTSAAAVPAPGFLIAFTAFIRSAPAFLETAWEICADLLALYAIVLLVAAAVRHRRDVLRDIVVALLAATAVWLLVARWIEGEWPVIWDSLRTARPPGWYPSPRIALPAATLVTASPHLTRPVRRLGRWLLAFGSLGVLALGATSALGAVAGVLVGAAAGAAIHLAFGSSAGRPSLEAVRRSLAQVGVQTAMLSPADRHPAGLFEVTGQDDAGVPLVVKIYGRDAHDSALATTIWRTLWYREPGVPMRIGRLQQVEHEAFVTLLAEQSGVLTESVITAGATANDDALLVLRGRGTRLVSGTVPTDAVEQIWQLVETLHRRGIAHGAIDATTLIVEDGRIGLVDFGNAAVAPSPGRLQGDRVQTLVVTTLLTDNQTAVAAAQAVLGMDVLAGLLPYLQRSVLTVAQRRAEKADEIDLDELRELIAGVAEVEVPKLQQLRRITLGTILRVVLPGLAILALTTAIAGLDLEGVVDQLIHATWWLLVLGFVFANLTRASQAVSTLGSSPMPLAFGPVYLMQLAMGYLNVAIPSYAARVAVSVRFFQRQGLPAGGALAAGFLDVMTTFFIEVIGITCMVLFTAASLDIDFSQASNAAARLLWWALVLIVVVIVVLVAVRRLRRLVVDWAKKLGTEALAVLRGLNSPRRLALLLGGNLATEVFFTTALGLFARSMGFTVPFADLLLIHLSVSLLAGLLPVPGGVGVSEALLTIGLVRSGMPEEAAFAAVIAYRASTFYLPPTWGFVSFRWLEKNKYL